MDPRKGAAARSRAVRPRVHTVENRKNETICAGLGRAGSVVVVSAVLPIVAATAFVVSVSISILGFGNILLRSAVQRRSQSAP